MSVRRGLWQRLRVLLHFRRVEDEMARELDDHYAREVERQIGQGLSPTAAARAATLTVGHRAVVEEGVRDERGGRWVHDLWRDVRVGVRALRRQPTFAATVVVSLALGVAGVAGVGSLVHAVIVQPLPYPDADRVFRVRVAWNDFQASLSAADFLRLREASAGVADVTAYRFGAEGYTLLGGTEPQVVPGAAVSPEAPRVLGVAPVLGRWFDERAPDGGGEVLISDALWRDRFQRSPGVLGQTLVLDRGTATVVGVMPPGFDVPGQRGGQLWLSSPVEEPTRRGPYYLTVALRPARGVTAEVAAARLTESVSMALTARYGVEASWRYALAPMKDVVVGNTRSTLWLFLAAAVLVLAVSCLNVANLMMARGAVRLHELAVRESLGAGRGRLVRQLVAEAALLGVGAAALGLVAADALIRVIKASSADLIPRMAEVVVSVPVALGGVVIGVAAAVASAAVPAVWLTGRALGDAMRDGGRTTIGGRAQSRIRSVLAMAEVALAIGALVVTALLVKTMARLENAPSGMQPRSVVTTRLVAPPEPYADVEPLNRYLAAIETELRGLPGVTAVALAESLPPDRLQQSNNYTLEHDAPQQGARGSQGSGVAQWNVVTPQFFDVLGVPLIQGRAFSDADGPAAPSVALVSRAFAERHFENGNVVGRRFKGGDWDAAAPWITVVGVVGDVPYEQGVWGGIAPTVYLPRLQAPGNRFQFAVVRSSDPPNALRDLGAAVQRVDPRVPLRDTALMTERLAASAATPRFRVRLFGVLAVFGVTLAITGLCGVLAYQVTARRRETAIRRALGASRGRVVGEVMRFGLALTALGSIVGAACALAAGRSLSGFLFEVDGRDPAAYAAALGVMMLTAAIACAVPALRAAASDPNQILREDQN